MENFDALPRENFPNDWSEDPATAGRQLQVWHDQLRDRLVGTHQRVQLIADLGETKVAVEGYRVGVAGLAIAYFDNGNLREVERPAKEFHFELQIYDRVQGPKGLELS